MSCKQAIEIPKLYVQLPVNHEAPGGEVLSAEEQSSHDTRLSNPFYVCHVSLAVKFLE